MSKELRDRILTVPGDHAPGYMSSIMTMAYRVEDRSYSDADRISDADRLAAWSAELRVAVGIGDGPHVAELARAISTVVTRITYEDRTVPASEPRSPETPATCLAPRLSVP